MADDQQEQRPAPPAVTTTQPANPAPEHADLPTSTSDSQPPRPAFIPLEANPELMTTLLRRLGLSPALACHDVYSITEPELLAFVPRPALSLLLVFPVSAAYESARMAEDAGLPAYEGKGGVGEGPGKERALWFRQTIRNACGLMGLLHAVGNGPARGYVEKNSTLDNLLRAAEPLPPAERARLLETNEALASAHLAAASEGATAAPDAHDDVDLHYVCFTKGDDGTLWELDGRRKGPLARGVLEDGQDVLSEKALLWGPLQFLQREGADMRFSCVALAGSFE